MEKRFIVKYTAPDGSVRYLGSSGINGVWFEKEALRARRFTREAAQGYASNPPVRMLPGTVAEVVET
jgi:hypothetical protein